MRGGSPILQLQSKFPYVSLSIATILIGAFTYFATTVPENEIAFNANKAVSFSSLVKNALVTTTEEKNNRMPASCEPSERGFNVVIPEGEIVYLDESSNIDTLTINGELHCDRVRAPNILELKVKTIIINGTFQCGTAALPYNKKLIISLKDSGQDPKIFHGHRGIIVERNGKLNLNGERKNAGWYKLGQTALPGEQSIFLDLDLAQEMEPHSNLRKIPLAPTLPWKVGDQIVLGPTGFNYEEAEKFTITSIGSQYPHEIFLDHPVQFRHWGEKQRIHSRVRGSFDLDERAEVANLTRSILIRADESENVISEANTAAAQIGGHIMVHYMGQAYIDSIELYKMGQAGIMARYPFHWHWVGNAPGQYIKNSAIHHSFQRCITVHRTHSTLVQNNVCYDFKGHGYFLEDGNEINNKIIHNLAIKAKAPSSTKLLLASDNLATSEGQGRFPSVSGFWISNPRNIVKNNVVSGSIGTGFWMSFENEVKDTNGNIIATPIKESTLEFNYNTAHATKVGITWDGAPTGALINNPNNPNDRAIQSAHYEPPNIPTFTGLIAFKNYMSGIYFRGQTVIYKNNVVADNGWSYWTSYNQIVKDSVFIGKTDNNSQDIDDDYYPKSATNGRHRKTGIILYDGPFEVHNSDFLDFSTQAETYSLNNGTILNSTSIPFISTGGTNKFTNVVSGLHFGPEPVYRTHIEDADENPRARFLLGNSVIRDLDGSLSGTGAHKVLTAIRSLGATAQSNCQSGGNSLHNYKVCPGTYREGSFNFMRWGAGPWSTPFVVKRNDGAVNYLINEWNLFPYTPNNTFAIVNNVNYSYELMPYYQYKASDNVAVDSNYETQNAVAPVVKIVAFGNNCRLNNGAVQVSSLAQLKMQTVTSYFTQGKDFYVRLIPANRWGSITNSPLVAATAYTTMPVRHGVTCDTGALSKEVLGNIKSVHKGATNTTVRGWACNYTHQAAIKVKLYAYGRALPVEQVKGKTRQLSSLSFNTHTYIAEMNSNQSSDEKTAFSCGKLTTAGRAFTFTIPNSTLAKFTDHKFYVKGISNTGGADVFISGSGNFKVVVGTLVSTPSLPGYK
jgi:hypothetical protein